MSNFLKLIIIESVIMLGGIIWVIYSIVKKQELFPGTFEGKEDIVAKVLALVVLVYIVVANIVPEYMDLPYFYNNEFCYIEGVSQSHSDKSAKGPHCVIIKNEESGEEIRVRFGYRDTIERGDRLKVKYLPNSKQAVLLEINGKKTAAG